MKLIKEELLKILGEEKKDEIQDFLNIAEDLTLNETNKCEGLLYYCIITNKLKLADLKEELDNETYNDIKTLIKLDEINFDQNLKDSISLHKMFFAITKDIRITILKIALIDAKLRHFDSSSESKENFSTEIFTLYAPLAARLGLSTYKAELENGAFRLQNPELYDKIQTEVDNRFHKRQPIVERLKTLVEQCLKDINVEGKVYGRKKHIYSIYKKLQDHTLDQIYDLIAVRAIVKNVADCYALLGRLMTCVEPYKDRFKDYISTPKPNGYQSLHTTVIFEGFPVEVQIRTEEMHKYADYGVAAHWLYKEKRNKQDKLDIGLAWIRQMMEDENSSIDELAESLNQDIYGGEIFVQTPAGKLIYLPTGATPIDFAYAIHSEVGNKCVGAKVNGKIVATNSELHNGDTVEIITNPNSKGPSRDWLKICKTSSARSKINSFFKKNIKEETIELGKSMLETAIKEKGYSVSKLTNNGINDILSYYNMADIEELYANIGTNSISAKFIANKLALQYKKQLKQEEVNTPKNESVSLAQPTEKQIAIKGMSNLMISFANCCHPMYGDDIIGFISAGRGVIIHRSLCPNVTYFRQSRLINASWKPIDQKEIKKKS